MRRRHFSLQLAEAAAYVAGKQNPENMGWGLNIERGLQASSIVNTTEAIVVLNVGRHQVPNSARTRAYLSDAIRNHPRERGNNLRFLTFGVWGLLELGVPTNDDTVQSAVLAIEERYISDRGWAEQPGDGVPRLWPTLHAFGVLTKVLGADYVKDKYRRWGEHFAREGRINRYKWPFETGLPPSLAATAYANILMGVFFPDSPDETSARAVLADMLIDYLNRNELIEVEAVPGTDWHHYSYAWATIALAQSMPRLEPIVATALARSLTTVNALFEHNRYFEPGKQFANVRSIFNNVLAVQSVVDNFDPSYFISFNESELNTMETPKSIFLSYSFRDEDKELVEGLILLLQNAGFSVVTGEKNPMGSISHSILDKIRRSEKFVVVMTCRDKKENGKFTTSSWLLEEKGAAITLGKPCLMLVEEGIDEHDIGGLQGDDQRLRFRRNNFTSVVVTALSMLSP